MLAAPDLTPSLGIDLGVTAFAATSAGVLVAPLGMLRDKLPQTAILPSRER